MGYKLLLPWLGTGESLVLEQALRCICDLDGPLGAGRIADIHEQ